MAQATYVVAEWPDGLRLQVKVRGPALLPKLAGHQHVVFRATIHTRVVAMVRDPMNYGGPMRHELTHVRQYHEYGWLGFLWRYYVKGDRTALEAQAAASAVTFWPHYFKAG